MKRLSISGIVATMLVSVLMFTATMSAGNQNAKCTADDVGIIVNVPAGWLPIMVTIQWTDGGSASATFNANGSMPVQNPNRSGAQPASVTICQPAPPNCQTVPYSTISCVTFPNGCCYHTAASVVGGCNVMTITQCPASGC